MTSVLLKNALISPKSVILLYAFSALVTLYVGFELYHTLIGYSTVLVLNESNISPMIPFSECLLVNESNISSLYYRRTTPQNNSSYPFISGDTFRGLADHVYDNSINVTVELVEHGDIIFLKADKLYPFFDSTYKLIKKSFVLITHNSDFSVPGIHGRHLDDEKLLAWYTTNPERLDHRKLFAIPIGLANSCWNHGNLNTIIHGFKNYRKPWLKRSTFLYVNFQMSNNRKERVAAYHQAINFKKVSIVRGNLSLDNYLQQIGNAKFVLSPPGNGFDCHRTWEALLMGAVPVVLTSESNSLFYKLPVVILPSWSNLTEKHLSSYDFSSYDYVIPSALCASCWRRRLIKYHSR